MEFKLFNLTGLKITGLILIISGFVFYILALKSLGTSWRLGIDDKNPGKLVTTGIYSFSRHPIYLFFNLYFLGTFLINGNLVFVIFAVLLGAVLHWQLIREEKFLLKVFERQYREYMSSTGRYFSFKFLLSIKRVRYLFRFEKAE